MEWREKMQAVAAYIREHAADDMNTQNLAAMAYVSKFYFNRLFQSAIGVSVTQYIREQKLHLSMRLLLTNDINITDIAYGLFFNSHDGFTRAFKRQFGLTPSEFRKCAVLMQWLYIFEGRKDMTDMFFDQRTPFTVPFTANDKRECLPMVEMILTLAESARCKGLLALESDAQSAEPLMLKKGLQMVCDGVNPDIVKSVMRNYLMSSYYRSAELLKRVLILEGVTAIQQGVHPTVIREILLSLLGEDFYAEACLHLGVNSDWPESDAVERYFENMEHETYPQGTNLLEDVIMHLDNRSIQIILRGTDMDNFVPAFRGSSKKTQKRISENLSKAMAVHVINICHNEPMPATDEIVKAQHVMLGLYHKLQADGE